MCMMFLLIVKNDWRTYIGTHYIDDRKHDRSAKNVSHTAHTYTYKQAHRRTTAIIIKLIAFVVRTVLIVRTSENRRDMNSQTITNMQKGKW